MDVGVNLKEDKKNTDDLKYDFMPDILEIIERPANRWGKTIIWFSVAFAVALFIWSMVSKMDVVILAQGKIVPKEGIMNVQMPYSGTIKEVMVRNGEQVAAGQILAYVEVDYADIEVRSALTIINRLKKENKIYQLLLDGQETDRILPEEIAGETENNVYIPSFYDSMDNIISTPDETENIMKNDMEDDDRETLLLSLSVILEQERQYQKSIMMMQDEQTKEELSKQHRLELLSKLLSNHRQIQELNVNLQKTAKTAGKQELKATKAGVVTGIPNQPEGMVLEGGTTIMQLVPVEGEMEIEAYVRNADIGNLQQGDKATIKINAYPYSDYGVIDGELSYISEAPMLNNNEYMYLIRVKLKEETAIEKRQMKLLTGMTASVEIKTGTRTVMEYFLAPLRKNVDQAMKEK